MNQTPGQNMQRESRIHFASTLTEFEDQRGWYDRRASSFKSRAQQLDILIIVAGALIAALPVLKPDADMHWSDMAVSFLGALVVIGKGGQRVFGFADHWPSYRKASELMKREWRLFVNAGDPYDVSDAQAKVLYVERLERVIAEEQALFFDQSGKNLIDSGSAEQDDSEGDGKINDK